MEYGWVAPKGPSWVRMLADLLDDELGDSLPESARSMLRVMHDILEALDARIADLDKEIARRAREDEVCVRLMTIPGIGPNHGHRDCRAGAGRRDLSART